MNGLIALLPFLGRCRDWYHERKSYKRPTNVLTEKDRLCYGGTPFYLLPMRTNLEYEYTALHHAIDVLTEADTEPYSFASWRKPFARRATRNNCTVRARILGPIAGNACPAVWLVELSAKRAHVDKLVGSIYGAVDSFSKCIDSRGSMSFQGFEQPVLNGRIISIVLRVSFYPRSLDGRSAPPQSPRRLT